LLHSDIVQTYDIFVVAALMRLSDVHFVQHICAGILGGLGNAFLLVLIYTKSTGELKSYSPLLGFACCVDFIYSILIGLVQGVKKIHFSTFFDL
jgi:hypothetical protein